MVGIGGQCCNGGAGRCLRGFRVVFDRRFARGGDLVRLCKMFSSALCTVHVDRCRDGSVYGAGSKRITIDEDRGGESSLLQEQPSIFFKSSIELPSEQAPPDSTEKARQESA